MKYPKMLTQSPPMMHITPSIFNVVQNIIITFDREIERRLIMKCAPMYIDLLQNIAIESFILIQEKEILVCIERINRTFSIEKITELVNFE